MKLSIPDINFKSFKTLMVVVFIYPILPLGLLAIFMMIYGSSLLLNTGLKHSSVSQVIYQFLLFSGGVSGLIGGLMVLTNRINPTSLLLYLHGAISYSFVAVTILYMGTNWKSLWGLHSFYIFITLLVVAYQLFLIVKKVLADYQSVKVTKVMNDIGSDES